MLVCHAAGILTATSPTSKSNSKVALTMSPSKKGFFFGSALGKANSLNESLPDSPSANSQSPLLTSMLSRVSEDKAMLSRHATADIEKPPDRVSLELRQRDSCIASILLTSRQAQMLCNASLLTLPAVSLHCWCLNQLFQLCIRHTFKHSL